MTTISSIGDISVTHYNDVIMSAMALQITILGIVYSTVYSGADQRKHQSSASLAFERGIHRSPVNSPHKGPVTWKMFPFDDVIMSEDPYVAMESRSGWSEELEFSFWTSCMLKCQYKFTLWILSTQRNLHRLVAILQKTFSNAFFWMKIFAYWFKFHWGLFLGVQFTILRSHWFM